MGSEATKSTERRRVFADPRESAIVVEYYRVDGEIRKGASSAAEKRTKKIVLGDLSRIRDVPALAGKVMNKCERSYGIVPSEGEGGEEKWIRKIEDAVGELCDRSRRSDRSHHRNIEQVDSSEDDDWGVDSEDDRDDCDSRTRSSSRDNVDVDSEIDEALELLYGSDDDKLRGTAKVLNLCRILTRRQRNSRRRRDNDDASAAASLEHLVDHHQLVSALARLFGDDSHLCSLQSSSSSSSDLTFDISKIFLVLSTVEEFCETLSSHRVGSSALRVVELELKRAGHRHRRWGGRDDRRSGDVEVGSFSKRGERVICVCLGILENLAENDFDALRKMMKKSLLPVLDGCLRQRTTEALLTTLRLLRKISIFEETAAWFAGRECSAVPTLVRLLSIPCRDCDDDYDVGGSGATTTTTTTTAVLGETIAVLFNLSFHSVCKERITSGYCGGDVGGGGGGVHAALVRLMTKPPFQESATRLLYRLSVDGEESRTKLVGGECSSAVMQLIQQSPRGKAEQELAGLVINLTLNPLFAEEVVQRKGIDVIVRRVLDGGDPILAKVMRNLSRFTRLLQRGAARACSSEDESYLAGVIRDPAAYCSKGNGDGGAGWLVLYRKKRFWGKYVPPLLRYLNECKNDDVFVDILGTLGNITNDDLPEGVFWHRLIHDCSTLPLLREVLLSRKCYDDARLEAIILCGNVCADNDEQIGRRFAESNVVEAVRDAWERSDHDTEFSLQALSTYLSFLRYEETRLQLLGDGKGTDTIDAIMDCLRRESVLKNTAESCLILIEDYDRDDSGVLGNLGTQIRDRRYNILNHVYYK